jgi:anti-sigma B factor antagonist
MNFSMRTETLNGVTVIALTGEVDLYTAPELKHELIRLAEEGAKGVVVDLSETTFLDSTTLGVLISGVKRLSPVGGRLELVVVDRNIAKLFDITGLDRVFTLHATRDEAAQAAQG